MMPISMVVRQGKGDFHGKIDSTEVRALYNTRH